jgi:hypothetical protein
MNRRLKREKRDGRRELEDRRPKTGEGNKKSQKILMYVSH